MKLEEGMYVRTKDGAIAKAEQIIDDEIHFDIKPIFSDGECLGYRWFYVKDVIKASHSIIDLVQVGDYVNGWLVEEINYNRIFSSQYWYCGLCNDFERKEFAEKNIKSIVTKEQFESMSYKVEEE